MPEKLDRCVADLEGKMNKRTGKPYTRSERFAICQSAMKKAKSSVTEEEAAEHLEEVDKAMDNCHRRMMKNGRAKNMNEAHQLCLKEMAKAGYDIKVLE